MSREHTTRNGRNDQLDLGYFVLPRWESESLPFSLSGGVSFHIDLCMHQRILFLKRRKNRYWIRFSCNTGFLIHVVCNVFVRASPRGVSKLCPARHLSGPFFFVPHRHPLNGRISINQHFSSLTISLHSDDFICKRGVMYN